MKIRKLIAALSAAAVLAVCLTACGNRTADSAAASQTTAGEAAVTEATESTAESETAEAKTGTGETGAGATETAETGNAAEMEAVRVGSLKGPTTMGLVQLMERSKNGTAEGSYHFSMATQPDELLARTVSGELDIALVPANMAAVLYNKTQGGIAVIDINTLGVLYCVTGDESIHSVKDLSGKTVLSVGQGATPEYVLNILLEKNGVTDCSVEFKSEATEIAALLKNDPSKIAVLPQPFVTAAQAQNEKLRTAFSLTEEWDALPDSSRLITGVTVVRREFLNENAEAVKLFLKEHAESAERAAEDLSGTAALIAEYGIIEKAPIAEKALPACNIVCISGEEMKAALSGYLEALSAQDMKAVGGKLPEADFYYTE
ncbi:MAG: ABC transporter substrate-binding protein [Stomatobaculum sp.]